MTIFILIMAGISFVLPINHLGEEFFSFSLGYPWCLKSAFMSCGFIGIGYLISRMVSKIKHGKWKFPVYLLIMIVFCSILLLTYKINSKIVISSTHHVAFSKAYYGNPALFMLDAICGIICVLALSLLIDDYLAGHAAWIKQMLCRIGIDSMGIFLIHKGIVVYLSDSLSRHNAKGMIWIFIIVEVAVSISCLLTNFIRRTLPEILGETRQTEKRAKA